MADFFLLHKGKPEWTVEEWARHCCTIRNVGEQTLATEGCQTNGVSMKYQDETPVGCKLILSKHVDPNMKGWRTERRDFVKFASTFDTSQSYPSLVPDNVYDKFLEDVEIPVGYKLSGETIEHAYRVPSVGSEYLGFSGAICKSAGTGYIKYLIVEKIQTKTLITLEIDGTTVASVGDWFSLSNPFFATVRGTVKEITPV